jgi:pyruvate ferredoxin oxidoreductase alpha subunit
MAKTVALTGNIACAEAMRQINPDVVAAYPITPQTTIVETFSNYVANGEVDTEYVTVESEHSAMSACVGAAAAGSRVMTATSSQGLALMWEILYIASSLRLPIVMHNPNRTLSGPINIHCDHQDSMGARDSGWIQLFSENAQEAYDNTIQAIRIAEDNQVRMPVMVCLDGFIISHSIDRLEMLEDTEVKSFVGEFEAISSLLDAKQPITMGPFDGLNGFFFEFKYAQQQALKQSSQVIKNVGQEFGKLSGRYYDLLEPYKMDDAEIAIVVLGSAAGTARVAVNQLRDQGILAGMIKVRSFRPFPYQELIALLSKIKAVAVMDRSITPGAQGGPIFLEICTALYGKEKAPLIVNCIYGLGGRDVNVKDIKSVYSDLAKVVETGKVVEPVNYLGLRS